MFGKWYGSEFTSSVYPDSDSDRIVGILISVVLGIAFILLLVFCTDQGTADCSGQYQSSVVTWLCTQSLVPPLLSLLCKVAAICYRYLFFNLLHGPSICVLKCEDTFLSLPHLLVTSPCNLISRMLKPLRTEHVKALNRQILMCGFFLCRDGESL